MKLRNLFFIFCILALLEIVNAADVAYVIKDKNNAETNVINTFKELELSYDIIDAKSIANTKFSNYTLIVIGDTRFTDAQAKLIPYEKQRSLIMNHYHADDIFGWSPTVGQTTTSVMKNDAPNHEIMENIGFEWKSYTTNKNVYYIKGISSGVKKIQSLAHPKNHAAQDSVLAYVFPGVVFRNGKVEQSKSLYFGLTNSGFWTEDSKMIFKNSVIWLLAAIDQDEDGWIYEKDCNDLDETIHPEAEEVPYDSIDQDCDGKDLLDVDGDGFNCDGNKDGNCAGIKGNDCNDYVLDDPVVCEDRSKGALDCNDQKYGICSECINLDAKEWIDDTDQNCKNDKPVLVENIPDQTWDEDSNLELDLDLYFKDPDGDDLFYGLGGTNRISFETNGNIISLIPDDGWFGKEHGYFTASDGIASFIVSNSVWFTVEGISVELVEPADGFVSDSRNVRFKFIPQDNRANKVRCAFYSDIGGEFKQTGPWFENVSVGGTRFIDVKNIPDGEFEWNILCEDGKKQEFAPENWHITIAVNDPPVFEMENEFEVNENEILEIKAVAQDPENSIVSYKINDKRFSQEGDIFKWKPGYEDAGKYKFIITASDGILESNLEINVTVNNVNRDPILIKNIPDQTWDEDSNLEIDLSKYFKDPDIEDILTYSVSDADHISATFQGAKVKLIPEKDWFGNEIVTFTAEDDEKANVESNEVVLTVKPVNDKPLLQQIPDIAVKENDMVVITAIANDPDGDDLVYSINDDRFTQEENIFEWQTDIFDAGQYKFTVKVSDGILFDEINVNVKVTNVNINPVLENIDPITIDEDSGLQEVGVLHASDEDGEEKDLIFSVQKNGNARCSVQGNKLLLNPENNFFGKSSCIIRVIDKEGGFDEQEVSVDVKGIDDVLTIKKAFPSTQEIKIGKNNPQNFFIEYEDVDNDPVKIQWFKDDVPVSTLASYTFLPDGIPIIHEIRVEISDGINPSLEQIWTLIVEDQSGQKNSCSDVGGFVCKQNEICTGNVLPASGTCCSIACTLPQGGGTSNLTNQESCSNGTVGNLDITIKEPDDEDEFAPLDTITINLDVENADSKDDIDDVMVEAFLLVKDVQAGKLDRIEKVKSEEIDIESDEDQEFELNLDIPDSDIDEDDEYILFVKAFEDGKEDKHCGEDQIDIDIERERHDVVISKFEIVPEKITCNSILRADLDIENIGTSEEEDMFVSLKIPQLNLEETSTRFTLEEFDGDNDVSRTLSLRIPETIDAGRYLITAEAVFDDDSSFSREEKEIFISECAVENDKDSSQKSKITDVSLESLVEKERGNSLVVPVEIKNTGEDFAEYQVSLHGGSLLQPINQNILVSGKKTQTILLDASIAPDAPYGEQTVTLDITSGGKLIESKDLLLRVKQPETIKRDAKPVYTLTLLNLLAVVIFIYFLVILLFR